MVLGTALAVAAPLNAQDEKELGRSYSAELTHVLTSGNAESRTLGLGAGLRNVWQRSEFQFKVVFVPLDKLDTQFTIALVATF